jgi:phosphoglycolate phosphatase-like HAD superfamily hydrolase
MMPVNQNMPAPALALFDIDGTLLRRAGQHHKLALVESVRLVTGCTVTLDGIPTQGMLDGDLLRLLLSQAGVPDSHIEAKLPQSMETAQEMYLSGSPDDLRSSVCPGVVFLLAKLARHGIATGLVTGNLSAIGWRKMELAGLRSHFTFGAFAEHGETRAALVAIAIREARRVAIVSEASRVSLIGDHPNDIRAARANGIQAIATATGLSTREELLAERPDILVGDLTELVLEQLL